MPEMSRRCHVAGGIDLARSGFNVTLVQWEHMASAHRASAMWQIRTRATSQPRAGLRDSGMASALWCRPRNLIIIFGSHLLYYHG